MLEHGAPHSVVTWLSGDVTKRMKLSAEERVAKRGGTGPFEHGFVRDSADVWMGNAQELAQAPCLECVQTAHFLLVEIRSVQAAQQFGYNAGLEHLNLFLLGEGRVAPYSGQFVKICTCSP